MTRQTCLQSFARVKLDSMGAWDNKKLRVSNQRDWIRSFSKTRCEKRKRRLPFLGGQCVLIPTATCRHDNLPSKVVIHDNIRSCTIGLMHQTCAMSENVIK